MIRGSPGCFGIDPTKPKLGQIEFFDEDIDHANGIVLADPVFQAFRKQRGLTAIDSLNEAPHPILPQIARESYRGNQNRRCVFTQAGSKAVFKRCLRYVRYHPNSGAKADIPALRICAIKRHSDQYREYRI